MIFVQLTLGNNSLGIFDVIINFYINKLYIFYAILYVLYGLWEFFFFYNEAIIMY